MTLLQKAFIQASQNAIAAAKEAEKRRQAEMLRLQDACDWVGDYLKYNAPEHDKHLCDN